MPAMMAQPGGARAEMTAPDRWTRPNANQRRALRTYQRVWDLHLRLKRLRDAYWAASGTADPRKSMEAIVGKDPALDGRLYSWLKRYDPRKGECGCGGGGSMETAKPMGKPLIGGGEWDESKHPRGQPGNAGQFAKSPGARRRNPVAAADKRPVVQGSATAIRRLRASVLDRVGAAFAEAMVDANLPFKVSTTAREALLRKEPWASREQMPDEKQMRDWVDFLDANTLDWDDKRISITAARLAERARLIAEVDESLATDMEPFIAAKEEAQEIADKAAALPSREAYEQAPSFWRGTSLAEALALAETGEWGAPAEGFRRSPNRGRFVCFSADVDTGSGFADGALIEADGDALRALANTDFDAGSPVSKNPDMRAGRAASWPDMRRHMAGHFESRIADETPVSLLPVRAIHVREGYLAALEGDPRNEWTRKRALAALRRIAPVYVHTGMGFGFPSNLDSTAKTAGGGKSQ